MIGIASIASCPSVTVWIVAVGVAVAIGVAAVVGCAGGLQDKPDAANMAKTTPINTRLVFVFFILRCPKM
ncbi:MAG: hypothetical protein R3E58_04770 [Phycisphaerae bacterium]